MDPVVESQHHCGFRGTVGRPGMNHPILAAAFDAAARHPAERPNSAKIDSAVTCVTSGGY
jgi:hypothetical protein